MQKEVGAQALQMMEHEMGHLAVEKVVKLGVEVLLLVA